MEPVASYPAQPAHLTIANLFLERCISVCSRNWPYARPCCVKSNGETYRRN